MSKGNALTYINTLEAKERARYEYKISLIGGRDPYALGKDEFVTFYNCLPQITYIDIVNYLINTKSAYTFEQLKAYKSMEAVNQLCNGWVRYIKSLTVDCN